MKKIVKKFLSLFEKYFKKWKFLVLLLLAISGFLFFRYRQASNQPQLNFINPKRQNIVQTLELSGYVDAKQKATLRFIAGGKVVYLGAKEGDFVKKWQTIATIDGRDLQKRLQQDLNNYMKERWDWEQLLDDTKDRWLPKNEVRSKDKSQWDLDNKVLDVEIRDIAISNTAMSAPFAGILIKSPTQTTGVTLLASDYFELIDPNSLFFRAEVDEEDIAKVIIGQSGQLTLDAYPNEIINTQIAFIAYQAKQTTSGTVFEVELPITSLQMNVNSLPASEQLNWYKQLLSRFRLGMNGDVKLELARKENVLSVPVLSTKERDGKVFVDVKVDNQPNREQTLGLLKRLISNPAQECQACTQEREIKIGLSDDDYVEVLSGLSENELVLLPD